MAHSFKDVAITDVSRKFAVIGVMGPRARELLQPLTELDLENSAFHFGRAKVARVAEVSCRLTRISYVGELGWEVSCLAGEAPRLWRALCNAGSKLGVVPAGMYAMNTLRLEKGYRHWGHDISPEDNPYEAGLDFFLRLDKSAEFVGQAALVAKKNIQPSRQLMSFRLEEPKPLLHGNEPIFAGEKCVGWITSGGFGHSLGVSTGLGYVSERNISREFEIEVAGERFFAVGSLKPLYQPNNPHIRA
jgi:glycine cleavage system aminomethyltransferase T